MRKKLFITVLVMMLALVMNITVMAEENKGDNLSVTITTDKEEYYKNDKITFTVELKNEALYQNLLGMTLTEIAPDGYKLQCENLEDLDTLKAGKSLVLTMTAHNAKETGRIVITTVIVVGILVGILVWVSKMNRKKRNQAVASVMVMLLISSSYLPMTVQAEGNKVEQEVYHEVRVDNEELKFGICLTYELDGKVLPAMTEEEITLTFLMWEEGPVMESLYEEWQKKYPNIKIEFIEYPVGETSSNYIRLDGTSESPDISWVLGSPDFYIQEGDIQDLTEIWNLDPDTRNIIGGMNEFGIGCMGTDSRWTIPVRFYPALAWINMDFIGKLSTDMPSTDWTFEEMMLLVESLTTGDDTAWGLSEGLSVITWYPIASDPDCIGEFGWDGKEFDLTNWAEGMAIENEIRTNGYVAPGVVPGTADVYPQDEGMVAICLDHWWAWERYWNRSEMYDKYVYWVPYKLPHTEANQGSTTNLATIDCGVISSGCEYPREAYEVLKFFCWGAEGWEYKLTHFDEIMANSVVSSPISSCPITLDKEVWEKFIAMHPSSANGDPEGEEMGIDRTYYFDAFFEHVRNSKWTAYGGQQIAGFDSWWVNQYHSAIKYGDYMGIEEAVFDGGKDPKDYVKDLTESANAMHKESKELLEKSIENR